MPTLMLFSIFCVFFPNTPGVTRTLNLRIWNPLLCQLSYRRPNAIKASNLLPLDLVEGVFPEAGAILFESLLHLFVNSTLHADTCTVIKITGFRALEPNIFSICCLLGHCSNLTEHDGLEGIGESNPHKHDRITR